ncbi:hypothetical protein M899_0568 [Bacteriovorax sp. BSW11_IV]|uniref:hypothetical protein n=1 Tax=Bacteriovorax sp. BSW11_IV TaxID=1353529 RepID=UPI00038A3A0B|nr:hypothetical protein [Bacteriovorax sp. BSW11_IV]EQC44928.1 hypothetical protein M899_0568 [Bacteriovorax sp. BSW11_IV]
MDEVRSRRFIKQYHSFSRTDQGHIDKAIQRILQDPTLNAYKRYYLTPYRQEHPSNAQHTLFFEEIQGQNIVFFVWLNDYQCLHDTTKPHKQDPCLVEFTRLRQNGELETFDKDYHLGKLTALPKPSSPYYVKFEVIDYEIHFHILSDGTDFYTMGVGYHDNQSDDDINLTMHSFKLFLDRFAEHLNANQQTFEFRLEPNALNQEMINILTDTHDNTEWQVDQDNEFFYLRLI